MNTLTEKDKRSMSNHQSPMLCSWSVGGGILWVQTDNPRFSRKLSKRRDTRLVAVGVAGGFLRIFAARRSPAFMRRLIARYMAANRWFLHNGGTQQRALQRVRVKLAQTMLRPHKSENPHDGESADFQKFTPNRIGSESTGET